MKSKKMTGRIIAYILVFTLLMQYALTTSADTAYAVSEPKISSKSEDILVGEKHNFNIINKVKRSNYNWKSSDSSVAMVDDRGFVTGVSKGKVTITCTVSTPTKNYKLTSKVAIRKPAELIEINNKIEKIYVGEKYNLNKTISPAASNDKTTWTSSDASIAYPDKNGVFTALKPGQVTITANTISGEKDSVTIRALDETNSLILTKKSVVDGKISLSDVSYDYITIDSSVGDAEIIFDKVKITDTLEMETNASYTIRAINSDINRVVSLEEEEKAISSFSLDSEEEEKPTVAPTFIAEEGTLVVTVDARGNVSVRQEGNANIGTVSVNRRHDGNIELNLDGFKGNLVVNTISNADIAIVTKNCNIPEATIGGINAGQNLSMKDNTTEGNASSIGKIKVDTNAKLKLDVPANEMEISENTSNASITIDKPIDKITNSGSSTRLQVNSNVSNIVSTGAELSVKVEAGSTIKGIDMAGASSKVDVALGSTIENIVSKGSDSAITGKGKVKDVKVEGNNTKIDTKDTNVSVGDNVEGTVKDGEELPGGTGASPTPAPVPGPGPGPGGDSDSSPTPTPTPILGPETGEIIFINNPGYVWAGTNVQMTADHDDIRWSVYNTEGNATINPETGVLSPICGTVRVVATSKLNSEVYGAVDIVIQDRRFVRLEPIEEVVINDDRKLVSVLDLENVEVLPTKVSMVYEKGDGTEEIIEASLSNRWFGDYDGVRVGSYFVGCWINIPSGYERPDKYIAYVVVKVKVSQTDNRVIIKDWTKFDSITLSSDDHIIHIYELFNRYSLMDKEVAINLHDGNKVYTDTYGYFSSPEYEFNGAVKGTYNIKLVADVPIGYVDRDIYRFDTNSVSWSNSTLIGVPLEVIVNTPQTPRVPDPSETGYSPAVPTTTQPKFTPTQNIANIESVTITGYPSEITGGTILNFNDFVTVLADTDKASDRRVVWTVNGLNYYNMNPLCGQVIFDNSGTYTIRATSVIDKSKYAEVEINVTNDKSVTSYIPFDIIYVNEDMGINNFRSMFLALEDRLPNSIQGNTLDGQTITIPIRGWELKDYDGTIMEVSPDCHLPGAYSGIEPPHLSINIKELQADDRIVVVSGTAISSTIELAEDRHATNVYYLGDALYPSSSSMRTIPINATLGDGTVTTIECIIIGFYHRGMDELNYKILPGRVTLVLDLILPNGYKINNTNPYSDLQVEVEVNVMVEQTSIYELLWVSTKPIKMDFKVGETLDLSGMIVRIGDAANAIYVDSDRISEYGLVLRRMDPYNSYMTLPTTLTLDMNNEYIYLFNPSNNTAALIGRITVTE